MQVIDGKKIAGNIIARLKNEPVPQKTLAAVLVGDDLASLSFIKQKEKMARELGIDFKLYIFGKDLGEENLIKEIKNISESDSTGGVIVQLPLPENINKQNVLNAIPQEKDIDVLSQKSQEAFRAGTNPILPPAVGVVQEILTTYNLQLTMLKAAIVGLGFLVGKPTSVWLKDKVRELFLLDIGDDLSVLKNADLIICGTGQAGLIKPEMLKNDAAVIDFGYSLENVKSDMENGNKPKIKGDFDPNPSAINHLAFYTPTPGGTGPILVAKLLENFYKLNKTS